MKIVPYIPEYAREITDLFHDAVHRTAGAHYSAEQREAWAPTPPDYAAWALRLTRKKPFVALLGASVAGFIELEADGHIDCLYVHKDHQRSGVASNLYRHLEGTARKNGLRRLYVEASFPARPFFEKKGFTTLQETVVIRNNVKLVHFRMEKTLAGST